MAKKKKKNSPMKLVGTPATKNKSPAVSPLWLTGSPSERKKVFARNLDWLLNATGLSRKSASELMEVDYRVLVRWVSAGISREDERNQDNLTKVVEFFLLKTAANLWASNFDEWQLLTNKQFVKKFRPQLEHYHKSIVLTSSATNRSEIKLLERGLGTPSTNVRASDEDAIRKVRFILSSKSADQFRSLINDYFDLEQYREAI